MKKIISVLIAIVLMASIFSVSCAPEQESEESSSSPTVEEESKPSSETKTESAGQEPESSSTTEAASSEEETKPETVIITDSSGREIEIACPVDRAIVVYSQLLLTIKAIGVEDEKIIGLDEFTYGQYEDIFTGLKDRPTVGRNLFNLDLEKIIDMEPQVVIGTPTTISRIPELEEELGKVGIKVVGLDFKMQNVEDVISTLGTMFGKEERAKEYSDFWFSKLEVVGNTFNEIGLGSEEKVKVYWENTSSAYTTISSSSSAHELVEMAGGLNIARELIGSSPEVDPEWVITENPEVIMKYPMGAEYQGGFGQTDTEPFEEIRVEIMERPGFRNIRAVQNGDVYVMSQIIKTGAFENAAICYIAKILYPDLFEDLDPEEYLREMVEKYLGLDWEVMDGVFIYPNPWE
jgi:iron complex transport system substrate-binding protein